MQRSQVDIFFDSAEHRCINAHALRELFTAVYHAMSNGGYVSATVQGCARFAVRHPGDHPVNGGAHVWNGGRDRLFLTRCVAHRNNTFRSNALNQPLRELDVAVAGDVRLVRSNDLKFERGGTGVQYQDVHMVTVGQLHGPWPASGVLHGSSSRW